MMFVVTCTDKPDSLQLRKDTRAAHLAYLDGVARHVVQGGPLLDEAGQPCGSLLMVEFDSRDQAQAFADADPYGQAGLFGSVTIQPYRSVYRDGAQVG